MGRYSVYVRTKNDLYTIPFETGGKTKDKTDIELFDIYFNYKVRDVDEFLSKMNKQGKIKGTPLECFIGYKFNGEIKKKPIIINQVLGNAAVSYAVNKKNAKDKKHVYIDNKSYIKDFIDSIVDLGVNNNDAFKSMFKSKDFPKHVYDLINDYRKTLKKKAVEEKEYGIRIYKYDDDIKEILNQINYNIRKYNYFRSIFVWKDNYLKKDTIKNTDNGYIYEMDLLDWANMNKEQTSADIEEELTEDELDEVNDFYQGYKNQYSIELSNANIDYYFKHGGLEAVLANCDLEEIESLSNEEKNYIGYHSNNKGR